MPPTPKASGFVNVYEGSDGVLWTGKKYDSEEVAEVAGRAPDNSKRIACIDLSQIDLTPFLVEAS
jgi:hypothetical protein